MSHKHLTIDERIFIHKLLEAESSLSRIAETLGCNKSTISREVKRLGKIKDYNPYKADKNAKNKSKIARRTLKIDALSLNYLFKQAQKNWSPDQIINRYLLEKKQPFCISVSTIYRYFKKGLFQLNQEMLRNKGKHRKRNKTSKSKEKVKLVMNITRDKEKFGHWEADLIVGKNHKSYRLTITEKLSNLILTFALKGKTSKEITNHLIKVLSIPVIKDTARTITVDNGTEFGYWKLIEEKTNIPVYFARPGTPWEKPTIEHANKLIREYLPKKSNLNDFPPEYDYSVFKRLNNRPRKKLGYKTPLEVFYEMAKRSLNKPLISFKENNIIECKF